MRRTRDRLSLLQDVRIVATTISQRVSLGYSAHTFHEKPLASTMMRGLTELRNVID